MKTPACAHPGATGPVVNACSPQLQPTRESSDTGHPWLEDTAAVLAAVELAAGPAAVR